MPLFSIITITRNNRDGLSRTAKSILNQTYPDYEWIIIDGASTDGTGGDLPLYTTANITSEADRGIYDAMNKGINKATGDYILFLNAGDEFATPNVLNDISGLTENNPPLIYGDSLEGTHYKTARHHSKIVYGMFTHHQAMFYNRKALGKLRYTLDYKIAADYDLTLRFLRETKSSTYHPAPICIFEQGGISQQQVKRGRNEQFQSRKANHACSTLFNHGIRSGQIALWQLRTKVEPLYWALKKLF